MESCLIESYRQYEGNSSEDCSCETGIDIQDFQFIDPDRKAMVDDISVHDSLLASKYKLLSTSLCNIRDIDQKCLVLQQLPGNVKLVAAYIQGLNAEREEKISMSFYATRNLDDLSKRHVALGLAGKNLYLSCSLEQGEPQVNLEKVNTLSGLNDEELLRFLFLKCENGPTFKFEPALCRGWYISTSRKVNETILMKPEADQKYVRDFLVIS
ncbi:interleukin-1 receptor antagonist protein-like isoform X2 [Pelobates fuscus]